MQRKERALMREKSAGRSEGEAQVEGKSVGLGRERIDEKNVHQW
jgi:hypothetical protein